MRVFLRAGVKFIGRWHGPCTLRSTRLARFWRFNMTTNKNDSCRTVAGTTAPARTARPVARVRRRHDPFASFWPNLEALFGPSWAAEEGPSVDFRPAVELRETDEAYELRAELPGVKREDIELKIEDQLVILRGQKQGREEAEEGEGGSRLHRSEMSFGSFERRFRLPTELDAEGAEARFLDGVLTVRLPKLKPESRSRVIPVDPS